MRTLGDAGTWWLLELDRRLWLLPPMAVTAAEASAEAEDVELIRFITNFTYEVVKKRVKPSLCVESILVDLSLVYFFGRVDYTYRLLHRMLSKLSLYPVVCIVGTVCLSYTRVSIRERT